MKLVSYGRINNNKVYSTGATKKRLIGYYIEICHPLGFANKLKRIRS